MTPLVEANHNFAHDGNSPALQQRWYSTPAYARLTTTILGDRENSLLCCIVFQIGSSQHEFCDQYRTQNECGAYLRATAHRIYPHGSRAGCIVNSTIKFRSSASSSIDIATGAAA
jgi:hypothetical protein